MEAREDVWMRRKFERRELKDRIFWDLYCMDPARRHEAAEIVEAFDAETARLLEECSD